MGRQSTPRAAALAALFGAVVALAALAPGAFPILAAPAATPAPSAEAAAGGAALVYTVTLDDAVHPITSRFLREAIDRANREGAALLIIKLDTPGGLGTSM